MAGRTEIRDKKFVWLILFWRTVLKSFEALKCVISLPLCQIPHKIALSCTNNQLHQMVIKRNKHESECNNNDSHLLTH